MQWFRDLYEAYTLDNYYIGLPKKHWPLILIWKEYFDEHGEVESAKILFRVG